MASRGKALVPAQPPDPDRWQLIRDVAVLQVKLVVDGLRDVLLSPASLIAALGDLILGRNRAHGHFYQVVRFGRTRRNHDDAAVGRGDRNREQLQQKTCGLIALSQPPRYDSLSPTDC